MNPKCSFPVPRGRARIRLSHCPSCTGYPHFPYCQGYTSVRVRQRLLGLLLWVCPRGCPSVGGTNLCAFNPVFMGLWLRFVPVPEVGGNTSPDFSFQAFGISIGFRIHEMPVKLPWGAWSVAESSRSLRRGRHPYGVQKCYARRSQSVLLTRYANYAWSPDRKMQRFANSCRALTAE